MNPETTFDIYLRIKQAP